MCKEIRKIYLIALLLLMGVQSFAAVRTVTTLDDTDDRVCDEQCSLREAIDAAAAGDTIVFARQLRGGTIILSQTIEIRKRLIIDGPNKRRITLRGDGSFRILDMSGVLTIDGLIISGGNAGSGNGGGIRVLTTNSLINLTNVGIIGNTAARGGGIFMPGGTLFIRDSTIAGNTASGDGGAGGIDTYQTIVRIVNSTVSNNTSLSAVDGVGGIKLDHPSGWSITNCTIAFNSANATGLGSVGGLAGILGQPGSMNNTILAKNNGRNPDFYGQGGAFYSLIGRTDSPNFANGLNGNVVGSITIPIDPLLQDLGENGGGLPTHPLAPTSPAIDSGDTERARDRLGVPLEIDQRAFNRVAWIGVDMGAYEAGSHPRPGGSTITGRVIGNYGRGVYRGRILLHMPNGDVRYAHTNPFGYFRFFNIPSGSTYLIECTAKNKAFESQTVLIEEIEEHVDFLENSVPGNRVEIK